MSLCLLEMQKKTKAKLSDTIEDVNGEGATQIRRLR